MFSLECSDCQFCSYRLSISLHHNYQFRRIGFSNMFKMDQTPFDSLYNAIDLLGSPCVAIFAAASVSVSMFAFT
jgi:hypothetical protein